MNLKKFETILTQLKSVGIKSCIMDVSDKGTILRSIDPTYNIATYCEIDLELPKSACITDIDIILAGSKYILAGDVRVDFDFNYRGTDEEADFISRIILSNDNSDIALGLVPPSMVEAPTDMGEYVVRCNFDLPKENIKELIQSISTFIKTNKQKYDRVFHMDCSDDGNLSLKFSDNDGNFLKLNVAQVDTSEAWQYSWNIEALVKLLKLAVKTNGKDNPISISVLDTEIMVIKTDEITFLLLPEELV